jgi:hypothetical protein
MMTLTSIGAYKDLGTGPCQGYVRRAIEVFYAFIDQVQKDLMAALKSGLRQPEGCGGTIVRRGNGEENSEFPFHEANPQEFILNNHILMKFSYCVRLRGFERKVNLKNRGS